MLYVQNVGVLIFFLISGFVIAFTLDRRSRDPSYGFARYAIDRAARIYTSFIPALLIISLIDGALILADRYDFGSNAFSISTLLANIAMLCVYRVDAPSALNWPTFGTAAPLWTLAIEFHIYLFVGAVFFFLRGDRWWPMLLIFVACFARLPLSLLFGAAVPEGVGQSLFALWLCGFALAHVLGSDALPRAALATISISGLGIYAAGVVPGHEYAAPLYVYLAIFFGGLMSLSLKSKMTGTKPAARIVKFFAEYSFTLYLIHYSILIALREMLPLGSGWSVLVAVCVSNVVSMLVARFTERYHKNIADKIWIRVVFPWFGLTHR